MGVGAIEQAQDRDPLKHHRDGSVSFYIRDPDGIVIQILYEPAISPRNFS